MRREPFRKQFSRAAKNEAKEIYKETVNQIFGSWSPYYKPPKKRHFNNYKKKRW